MCSRILILTFYVIGVNIFGFLISVFDLISIYSNSAVYQSTDSDVNKTYDYIIVGSGSAGSILAKRLSRDKNIEILLIESGSDVRPNFLDIPSMGLMLQGTSYDWGYKTVPQKWGAYGLIENRSVWPMGNLVGGTAQFNNLMYLRGHPDDFKLWYKDKPDFSYTNDILPYFKKLENFKGPPSEGIISQLPYTSMISKYVLDAFNSLGYKISNEIFDSYVGFGQPVVNIYNGSRWTSSHQLLYLDRTNVKLVTKALALEVLLHDNYEAYGIKYSFGGEHFISKARKGVILSAGVIGTPKILMLSGIGPEEHLKERNIETRVNLPVGKNLQDHLTSAFALVTFNETVDFGMGLKDMVNVFSALDYFYDKTGPWATVGCEVLGFVNTKDKESTKERPNLQFMVMPLGIEEDSGWYLRKLMGISDVSWSDYFSYVNSSISVLPVLLHPKSRGTVRLNGKDLEPLIDPNYLSHQDDIDILYQGIQIIKDLVNTKPMQLLGAKFNTMKFPGCEQLTFDTKIYWECYIRHLTITAYHPVGTCKMGVDEDSVVNFNFQVKGTNKLYVVDGSVLPTLTSGNINAAIMMMAEKASDIISNNSFLNIGFSKLTDIFYAQNMCNLFPV